MTQNLISIGQAASFIQAMPSRISAAAVELGIEPSMRLNGAAYFTERDLEQIAAHLRSRPGSGNVIADRAGGIS